MPFIVAIPVLGSMASAAELGGTLSLALAAAAIKHLLGLSMAFGAFLAGMMLGETEFRHQVESAIRPFPDVLLGLFFIGIGMLFDPMDALTVWHWALRGTLDDPVRNRGVAGDAMVVAGSPLEAIADGADAIDADLLVLGARGESCLRHALLGSTASRLLRKSIRRPVLVVKQPPRGPYRRLLIPVDFSRSSEGAIRLGRRVAPQADIVLLHAFELPFEGKLAFAGVDESVIREYIRIERDQCRRRLHDLARTVGLEPVQYSAIVRHGDPSQQFIAEEQEGDCDLIVMGKHGTPITEELLLGSVTKHVLYESQCDVMVVPAGTTTA